MLRNCIGMYLWKLYKSFDPIVQNTLSENRSSWILQGSKLKREYCKIAKTTLKYFVKNELSKHYCAGLTILEAKTIKVWAVYFQFWLPRLFETLFAYEVNCNGMLLVIFSYFMNFLRENMFVIHSLSQQFLCFLFQVHL